ncbi:MAG: hypothetical protein R6U32_02495 [Candidatus Woesearchaeota archaeon]
MRKKEDIGYGIVIIFVLVSIFMITLMVPFDTATGAAILDLTEEEASQGLKNILFGTPVFDFVILLIVGTMIIAGSMAIIHQRREAEEHIGGLPLESRVELRDFVAESIDAGFKKEDIHEALLNAGWDEATINSILRLF